MELTGFLLALGAAITWGFLGIFGVYLGKMGLTGTEIAFVRLFSAFIVGSIYLTSRKDIRKTVSLYNVRYIALIGVITQGIMNLFLYKSIIIVGTVTATLLLCTGPIFTLILSTIILKEEMNLQKKLAMVVSVFGALLLVTEGEFGRINFHVMGVIMGALAGIFYGIYPILSRKMESGDNPLTVTIYSFLIGSLVLLPSVDLGKVVDVAMNFKNFSIMLGFGLLPTVVPYLLFLKSLNYIDTGKASIITMAEIPASTVIGVFILKEEFNIYKFLGIVLIIFGMLITKIRLKNKNQIKGTKVP